MELWGVNYLEYCISLYAFYVILGQACSAMWTLQKGKEDKWLLDGAADSCAMLVPETQEM
eukprot:1092769-Amphidinium_carterae.1